MKKVGVCYIIICILIFSISTSNVCALKAAENSIKADSLNLKAEFSLNGKNINKQRSFKGKTNDCISIKFKETETVDTVVLYEKKENVNGFEIFAMQNGSFQKIYQQDRIGKIRYCAFSDLKTDEIQIKIIGTDKGKFHFKNIEVLNTKPIKKDFRITSYFISDRIYKNESLDKNLVSVISDAVLFGVVSFDENGKLNLADFEIDGEKINGINILKKNVEDIRRIKPEIKIYVNVLGPSDDDYKKKELKHTLVFKEHKAELCKDLKDLILKLGVDGIYFDYEYPYSKKAWRAYSDFLVSLRNTLESKFKIGVALGPWGKALNKKAKNSVDYYETMAYDMFDKYGNHSAFSTNGGVLALDFMSKRKYDLSKTDLGLPFYSRPVNKDPIWLDYASAYKSLGRFKNSDKSEIIVENKPYSVERYYNSYQMIFDKTAYAYDVGAGGVMVWHYSCDVPFETGFSLFEAISKAVNSRAN
ncbi:MAG: glycosyl hydrolase family 18 protein [Candidatus Fimenecus sp.]